MFTIAFAALAPETNKAVMWEQPILLVIWVFLYDASISPLAFCVVNEVGSTRLRVKTVALGRCPFHFWFIIFGAATRYMRNPEAANWKGKTFFLYSEPCFLSFLWAYFGLPEIRTGLIRN